MRPSEKRALAEEKARQKEAEKHESAEFSAKDEKTGAPSEKKVRKEGFFQSHVRLITFAVCMILMLTVLGPWGVDRYIESGRGGNHVVDDKVDIDLESVYSISHSAGAITFKSLDGYNYTDLSYEVKNGKYYVREYPIDGSALKLKIGAQSLSSQPDYIYLIDYRGGEYANIMKEDAETFVDRLNSDRDGAAQGN